MDTALEQPRTPPRERAAERLLVPVRYALRRLRLHPARTLVAALGIAVAAAVLALTLVASTAAQDRAVQRALAQLQPSDRAVQAVWSGVPAQSSLSLRTLDRLARAAITPVLGLRPSRVEVFRQATWGGAFVNLGAVDGLARWVDLLGGRLPRPCTPAECELLQIGGAPVQPRLPGLRVVGRGAFRPGAPFGQYFGAGGESRPPILVANGVLGFARVPLPDAALIARTYGWVAPLAPRAVHDWQLARLTGRLDAAQASLERRSDIFTVAGPTDTIASIRATSRVAAQRLLVLGGDAAVLLLGFAVLASARLRRDHDDVRRRLTWMGARRSQLLLVAATESALVTLAASAVGWLAGAGAGALLARHLGDPADLAVSHALLSGRALGLAAALAAVTAAVMLVALRADELAVAGARVTAADTAALGALAAVLLALARGKADASSLQQSGTGVLLLLLPALVLFILAVAVARLLGPVLRGLERAARHAPAAARVALLSLARAPGEAAPAVVFLVLSVGIAVFAFAYRATLLQGERDQARYAVPAPYVLQEDLTRLVTIQQAAPRLTGTRVLRDSGSVSDGTSFTLLALPAPALPRIDGWRSDFAAQSRARLAAAIAPHGTPRLAGTPAPRRLRFTIAGDQVGLSLVVLRPRGDFAQVDLGEHGPGTYVRRVGVRGRAVALRLSFPNTAAFVADHKEAETAQGVNDAAVGTLRLGGPFARWLGVAGMRVDAPGVFHYTVNRAADSLLQPVEPLDGQLVPVLATPAVARTASAGGVLSLRVGDSVVAARVAAVVHRFPTVDGDAVVADLPTWLLAANTAEPGTTTASELWTGERPPAGLPLQVTSQRAQEAQLRGDPIARGSIALLLVVAAVGLALAVAGLALTVLGDRTGERASLRDLEAQGATPRERRRHLLLRAATVGGLGLAGGLAAGAVVGALVVSVVTVTAGAQDAQPPLLLAFDGPLLALALAAAAGAAALAAWRSA
ncbi:MAG TPA: hypothetical protein VFL60_09020 [Gaiellaceae bacterium]|nr:hypothetical protein [Gaiellaceae bacterium]